MNINRVTYFALAAFVFAVSCSKEAAEPDVYDWADGEIYFKTSLSDIATSRAQDMTLERLESFQVTCFNTTDDKQGSISPYFENATFIRRLNSPTVTTYVSAPDEESRDWPANNGHLRFFAFSPSITVMAEGNSAVSNPNNYFRLSNRSIGDGNSVAVAYGLYKLRINPDISRQFDFVTAEAAGERWKDFAGGVDLAFSHQLSQIELKAWGANPDYDYEIAGVRVGNPVVEGTYVFADDVQPSGTAGWGSAIVMDKVEYTYRGPETSGMEEGQNLVGDKTISINSFEHNTAADAASIMGNGGCAMVIPTVNSKWEGTNDPNIGATPYKTDRMYFSILLRVTEKDTGKILYPYPGNPYNMTVIYYAVDKSGNILSQLYPGEGEEVFYTDPELQNPYTASAETEIKDFGWAAVPVDADWSAGKKYIYTLDYSEGIGLHDPADTDPGKPIGKKSPISWGVTVSGWENATPDGDNYTPDLNVPGKSN
ncbi:MAG: fimbrillin family protein [Muribaculaceae bacterium]|nr:fimbrillin family protein [Muribaculaceae bacterium]